MRKQMAIATAITLLSLAAHSPASAQEVVTHRNIGLDSLMVLFQRVEGTTVYYLGGETSKELIFTVREDAEMGKTIREKLQEQGFSISRHHNDLFVLKGAALTAALPTGYFTMEEEAVPETVSKDYIDVLANESNVAVSQNKVYEIGDANRPKSRGYVSGYVRDAVTGEPVVGVVLFDTRSKAMATSDAHGFYRILLPSGESTVEVSGYSLEELKLNLKVFGDGDLDIIVREQVFALKGATISAENSGKIRSTEMGIEKVRIDRIKKVPAVFGEADVVKIILTLPGVKSVGEASNGFNVRGGATDQNLVLFNGGTVYNPSHLFGMFSAFNPDVVNDIELYKSSIPVEYGGRISSVLDVKSRTGNANDVTGSLGLGLLTARGHIEGPITKRTTFIAGVRATYSDWLLGLLPENSGYNNGAASFYDATLGLKTSINDKNTLYLNGYYSIDGFRFSADTSYRYNNMNASLKWRSTFSDRHNLELTAGYDDYGYRTYETANSANSYELSFKIRQAFAKLKFQSMLGAKHNMKYGADVIYYDLMPGSYLPYGENSAVIADIMDTENAIETAAYVSDTWTINDKLSLDMGVRYSLFNSTKLYHAPEFRVSGRYLISPTVSVKAGFNSMNQYIHMLSNTTSISPTDIWKLSDNDIRPQDGWQAAAGFYSGLFNNQVELSVEGYWKSMHHYLDYKSGAILLMNRNLAADVVETEGKAYGVEVMLKKPAGKLNGWVSYTYSKAQLREVGDRGINAINGGAWYNAAFDKPHDFKLVGNYKLTHRISFSLNTDYSTGRPVTVPVGKYYYGGEYKLYYGKRNEYRIPDYFRMDAAVNIEPTHKLKAFTHFSFTVGVYNVTGRKNVYSLYFDSRGGDVKGHMLCIFGAQIPYINLNFKF